SLGWFFSGPDRQVRSRIPSARYDGWPKCTPNSRRRNSRSRASKGQDERSDTLLIPISYYTVSQLSNAAPRGVENAKKQANAMSGTVGVKNGVARDLCRRRGDKLWPALYTQHKLTRHRADMMKDI